MPNCFQLFERGCSEPVKLQQVDQAIADHLGVPCDPVQWCCDWYHVIGFLIAMGKGALGSEALREAVNEWYVGGDSPYPVEVGIVRGERMLLILGFLESRYTSDAWSEIGRGR